MLHRGLTAAGLVVVAVVVMAASRPQSAKTTPIQHVCGALDRQFIRAAALSTAELALLGQDYLAGNMSARDALAQTRNASLRLNVSAPRDPSLKLTRILMQEMLDEYGKAIQAKAKGRSPGRHIYRSYSFAYYARQVLTDARPLLEPKGCSVGDLLAE
jgi:hypothetical protein